MLHQMLHQMTTTRYAPLHCASLAATLPMHCTSETPTLGAGLYLKTFHFSRGKVYVSVARWSLVISCLDMHQYTVRGPNVSLTRVPNNYEQCRATNQKRGSHKRQKMFNETYRLAKQQRGEETDPILDSIRTMIPSDHVMIMPLNMFHRGPVRTAANELSAYKIKHDPAGDGSTDLRDRQYRAICNVFSKTDLSASIKGRPKSIPLCIFTSP